MTNDDETAPLKPIVRFAPSPTGRLHIGNIRPALLNWLFARKHGGTFILRLDDTDRERSTEAFAEGIKEDLTWLGLAWARLARQSDRLARYAEAAETLKASGRLYPCFETEAELDRRRKLARASHRPPIYDRAGLKLTDADRAKLIAEGRRPHWRFRLSNTAPGRGLEPQPTLVDWMDLIRGDQAVDLGSLSDPVLIREDGTPLYTFCSVVDDIDFKITHIIRGEDHVTNTGVQIDICRALHGESPHYAHHSLLIAADGEAFSKRLGSLSLETLRARGYEPMAVASLTALIGTSEAIRAHTSLDTLAASLDLAHVSRAPARFDPAELDQLNAAVLHAFRYEDVEARLAAAGTPVSRELWMAIRGNLTTLADARIWRDVVERPLTPVSEAPAVTKAAARLLPPDPWPSPWDDAVWKTYAADIARETGAKGRALFHPLRLALTGREAGPELKALLPLIGRERATRRLNGETA